MDIPFEHWQTKGDRHLESFIQHWESQLRRAIESQPDPEKRFAGWLEARVAGDWRAARLTFIEQPYLKWAEAVDALIEKAEKDMRERIASEVANPNQD